MLEYYFINFDLTGNCYFRQLSILMLVSPGLELNALEMLYLPGYRWEKKV